MAERVGGAVLGGGLDGKADGRIAEEGRVVGEGDHVEAEVVEGGRLLLVLGTSRRGVLNTNGEASDARLLARGGLRCALGTLCLRDIE